MVRTFFGTALSRSLALHAWKALQVSSANRPKETKKNCQKKKEQSKRAAGNNNNKAFMQKDSSGRAKKNEKRKKRKRNIQEAQAESEAYKRISIIVDVIIIFHFQSKRYPIIAPNLLACSLSTSLIFLSLSLTLPLSFSCRTQHKESPRIKPTFHLFTRNARVVLKWFLLLLFKLATRRWLKQTNRTPATTTAAAASGMTRRALRCPPSALS